MRISEALAGVSRVFLDTAPVIYFVEKNPTYFSRVQVLFERIDSGLITAITSPITLSECLVHPYRRGLLEVAQAFIELITNGNNTTFQVIEQEIAKNASQLRARHNLPLADAFQIAVAMNAGCDAFLTNDTTFKRVTELNVIVLDELEREPEPQSD